MRRALIALVALAAVLPGCASSAAGDRVDVVATAYPLAWLAREVAPDAAVTDLAAAGRDPHDLELTPRQHADLLGADAVVSLGPIGFQPAVEAALRERDAGVVSVVEAVGADALRRLDGEQHAAAAGPVDPHVWFDPLLLVPVVNELADVLAAADPERAGAYRERARDVTERLRQLDAQLDEVLAGCRHDVVVVGHEAYGYLLAPRGLAQEGISPPDAHAAASPQRVAELAALVRELGLPAVLSEPVEGRSDAEAVAREAGVEVLDILSLDVVAEEDAERGYPQLLLEQAHAVARAADCS